jgi:hypothetical protein
MARDRAGQDHVQAASKGRSRATNAFDAALGRELHEVIQEAKKMASQIQQSSDLWDLEHYLTERRNRDRPQIRLSSIRDLQMCWGDF